MNCAFLSISNTEGWFIDDDLVHAPLQKLGWTVKSIPWNQSVDWDGFDLVIIRSPWDYQQHLNEFINVLHKIEDSKAVLLNSLRLVMWNINKNYLFDLENKGVELVPTLKTISINKSKIISAFEKYKTGELIVKPLIGANADDTFRIKQQGSVDFEKLEKTFKNKACMIQPFMTNILDEGEYSLMYFQGKLSHTILKTAKSGDYRVQEEHGGGVIPVKNPDTHLVALADKVIGILPEIPFYGRVDMVRTNENSFALMELELIEPCLYFRFDNRAAQHFAECINDFWNQKKTA